MCTVPNVIHVDSIKGWFDFLTFSVLILIALLQCLILYKQTNVISRQADREAYSDAEKRKLDLFEKRFLVFDAIREILKQVLSEDRLPVKDLLEFHLKIVDAEFLFNADINHFIDKLNDDLANFHTLTERIYKKIDYDDELSSESMALRKYFQDTIQSLHKLFTPYMKLS